MASPVLPQLLLDVCNRSDEYPESLLRRARPHEVHIRKSHSEYLAANEDTLFKDDDERLAIYETSELHNSEAIKKHVFTSTAGLWAHLQQSGPDPIICHAFLQPSDSRSPLDCSPAMLKKLLTYQQVEHSFLDVLYTFGQQLEPKDVSLMSFQTLDTSALLAPSERTRLEMKTLGRSSRCIHVSFLLRSVEHNASARSPWPIRQTAVHSTFDLETGRSFWLTVKGTSEKEISLFEDRYQESAQLIQLTTPTALQGPESEDARRRRNVQECFKVYLDTYLIYLNWCDEQWRPFINALEADSQKVVDRARDAMIDDHLKKSTSQLPTIPRSVRHSRQATFHSASGKTPRGLPSPTGELKHPSTWSRIEGATKNLAQFVKLGRKRTQMTDLEAGLSSPLPNRTPTGVSIAPARGSTEAVDKTTAALDQFRFSHLQEIHYFGYRCRTALLTIKLNIGVLDEMVEFFACSQRAASGATGQKGISFEGLKEECSNDVTNFLRELRAIKRRLETRQAQLESLATHIDQGGNLYEGALQYKSLHISQLFADHAAETNNQMKEIAVKTALQTSSMHILAVVTLIFLPGTFVATFFQSGVFLWNEQEADKMEEDWRLEPGKLGFFLWVCVPLMFVTVGLWVFVYFDMRRRANKQVPLLPSAVQRAKAGFKGGVALVGKGWDWMRTEKESAD